MKIKGLTRAFSLVSLAFILVTGAGLGYVTHEMVQKHVRASAEERNLDMALVFRNALWFEYRTLVLRPPASPAEAMISAEYGRLMGNVQRLMRDSHVVKIKLYDPRGKTIFSTDPAQVGEDQSRNAGFDGARQGKVVSGMSFRGEFDAFDGVRHNIDVVASYIPIYNEGQVQGVIEVYEDVTAGRAQLIGTLREYLLLLALALAGLYLMQFFAVRRMDATLRAKDAELRNANKELEIRVAERTADLSARTAELEDALAGLAGSRLRSMAGQEALSRMLRSREFNSGELPAILSMIAVEAAAMLDVNRVSFWAFDADRKSISQLGSVPAQDDAPVPVIGAEQYPTYFAALASGEPIVAEDARRHSATAELTSGYLDPHGIGAMLDVPVHVRGELWGVLCQEHVGGVRHWSAEQVAFATAAAALVALAVEGHERRDVERQLRDLTLRMQHVLDTAPAGIYMVNSDLRIAFHSRQANVVSGLPEGRSWIGCHLREFLLEIAAQGAYGEGDINELVDARMNTFLLARPDETLVSDISIEHGNRVLRVTRTPRRPDGFVVVAFDVTAETRAVSDLRVAKEAAESANAAKSEFLSSMSHELRTPMNAILGFGQLMDLDEDLSEENRDSLHEILRAGEHLLGLINQVLDLAKIESGHIDISLEPVAVEPLLEECLALVSSLANQRSIDLKKDFSGASVVRADRTRLKQALLNLLSNAVKYNREGGTVGVTVGSSGEGLVRITVSDTGRGIPSERLAELFQPFNRLNAENSGIEGTGIGLNITRRMVDMMGGAIDVASEFGVGSRFWIDLPCAEAIGVADEGEPAPPQAPVESSRRVLYIEDNPANIRLVSQVLARRRSVQLLTAHTPELGLELARTREPELILLDINLPGMDGYEVLAALKADPRLRDIPVVALTANVTGRDIARGMEAGIDDYLTKPLDVALFNRAVDAALGEAMALS